MFIRNFGIKNFKSIKNASIEPRKITVLIGPNSSGKSSFLQFLAILKQSLDNRNSNKGKFTIKGSLIDLGTFDDVVINHDLFKEIQFSLDAEFSLKDESFFDADTFAIFSCDLAKFSYSCGIKRSRISSLNYSLNLGDTIATSKSQNSDKYDDILDTGVIFPEGSCDVDQQILNNLLPIFRISNSVSPIKEKFFMRYFQHSENITNFFLNYHYIPTSRVVDEFSYPYVENYRDGIISSEGHRSNLSRLMSYLSSNQNQTKIISDWLEKLIGKSIRTKTVSSNQNDVTSPNITIEFVRGEVENSIINEGTGPNQLILLLTILAIAKNNSIIGLEEPEINLHPKGQSELAKIILDIAISRKQQIIFTTHSEHMLYPLLTSVASKDKNSLSKNDLAIYYCDTDEQHNTTTEKLEIDDYGRIKGGLKGFFEEDIDSLSEYLDALKNNSQEKS